MPRYPACPVQRLADGIQTDADRQSMLVMALALAGRAAVGIIDESRLQAWLAAQPQGQEASDRAEQLMVWRQQCCTCLQPADVLAAAAQRMLACARCIKFDTASGMADIYSAGGDGRATWKAVSSVDAADQQRWNSVLDSCMWQALQAMIDELSKAWQSGLQRLDVLSGMGLEEYVETYMDCWDVSGMSEVQRAQIRPSMAAAIKGARPLP